MFLRLASSNPGDAAIVDGNYFGTDFDLKATIKLARELGRQGAFDEMREAELIPGPNAGARETKELARAGSTSFGHPIGGCKIGIDEMAVVDPQPRVRGVEGLRVADSSVMPRMVTGQCTNLHGRRQSR